MQGPTLPHPRPGRGGPQIPGTERLDDGAAPNGAKTGAPSVTEHTAGGVPNSPEQAAAPVSEVLVLLGD